MMTRVSYEKPSVFSQLTSSAQEVDPEGPQNLIKPHNFELNAGPFTRHGYMLHAGAPTDVVLQGGQKTAR